MQRGDFAERRADDMIIIPPDLGGVAILKEIPGQASGWYFLMTKKWYKWDI